MTVHLPHVRSWLAQCDAPTCMHAQADRLPCRLPYMHRPHTHIQHTDASHATLTRQPRHLRCPEHAAGPLPRQASDGAGMPFQGSGFSVL